MLSLAVLTTACENLTPGENAGVFGAAAGLATGIPLGATGVSPSVAVPVTAGATALAAAGAYVIAKQQATIKQRKIAEERAREYLAQQQAAAPQASAKPRKQPRYIAVKTVKESTNEGKAQVMLFDTQSEEIVGNSVYDLNATPQVGEKTKFDTYTAEYVGTGS